MRRAIWWAAVPALVLLMAVPAPADGRAADEKPVTVENLAWLSGQWLGTLNGREIEEIWSEPRGDVLIGMFRMVTEHEGPAPGANRIDVYEFFALEPHPAGGLVLWLRHFYPGLKAWEDKGAPMEFRLVETGDRRAVFERHHDGEPTRLIYQRLEPGVLVAKLVKETRTTEFRYQLVGG